MYYRNPQLLFGQPKLNPVFANLTYAWPLSEDPASYMLRDAKGSGIDFMPVNATLVSGMVKFDGTRNSYASADGKPFELSANTEFMIRANIKPISQSGYRFIMHSGYAINAPSTCSWQLYRSGTTLTFRLYNSSTYAEVSATTSHNVEYIVQFGYDSVNQKISLKIDNGTPVTTTWTGGTQYKMSALVLAGTPGYEADDTRQYGGSITKIAYFSGYKSAAEQSTIYSLAFPYAALPNQSIMLDPDNLTSTKLVRFDSSDISTQFLDTAGTIPASANDDPIKRVNSKSGWGSNYMTEATNPPLLKTASKNGLNTLYSDGGNTTMVMNAPIQTSRTEFTMFFVAKSDWTSGGLPQLVASRWIGSNIDRSYMSQTSPSYTAIYYAVHLSQAAGNPTNTGSNILNPTDYNCFELLGDSGTYIWGVEGTIRPSTTAGNYRASNPNPLTFNQMFQDVTAQNWDAKGNFAEMFVVQELLSVATRARIQAWLANKWGVTYFKYYGY